MNKVNHSLENMLERRLRLLQGLTPEALPIRAKRKQANPKEVTK